MENTTVALTVIGAVFFIVPDSICLSVIMTDFDRGNKVSG